MTYNYDPRFGFAQPTVNVSQTRSACKCYPNGYKVEGAAGQDRKVAFLQTDLPRDGESLSDAIKRNQKETNRVVCKPFDPENPLLTDRCNAKVTNIIETKIIDASEILYVAVDRLSLGMRSNKIIFEPEIHLDVNGARVDYDLIGGLLQTDTSGISVLYFFLFLQTC